MPDFKLRIFAVAVSFQNGVGGMSMVPAYSEAHAVGAAVVNVIRATPAGDGELTHVIVREVEPAFLRSMLQAVETGETAKVIQLVPQSLEPAQGTHQPEGPPAA